MAVFYIIYNRVGESYRTPQLYTKIKKFVQAAYDFEEEFSIAQIL